MTSLPTKKWGKIQPFIQMVGEHTKFDVNEMAENFTFLCEIGVFTTKEMALGLTHSGRALYESLYIRRDDQSQIILQQLLLSFRPTQAIQQYLWGIKSVDIEQVLSVLKFTNNWTNETNESLTHFLDLLNQVKIICYSKKNRQIQILISPDSQKSPQNIFIDPKRPYSNLIWIKRVLGECQGYIYWLDKHFQKEALEWMWSIADASKINQIKILSLDLGDANLNKEAKQDYKRLKKELSDKGIEVIWATIDSKDIRDDHDRWIMGSNEYLRNVPNVNAIMSGQRSEINQSDNSDEVLAAFNSYWKKSKEISN